MNWSSTDPDLWKDYRANPVWRDSAELRVEKLLKEALEDQKNLKRGLENKLGLSEGEPRPKKSFKIQGIPQATIKHYTHVPEELLNLFSNTAPTSVNLKERQDYAQCVKTKKKAGKNS